MCYDELYILPIMEARKMNVSLREIEYILAIVEEGTITKAASRLYIAQPSLSQAIKKVENELGVALFTRVKGGISLTEAGKVFVESGRRIIGIAKEAEAGIGDLASLRTGFLNLGTPYHLGAYVVPDLLSVFRLRYPGIRVTLHEATSDDLEQLILDGRIHAAVMPLPFRHAGIDCHPFFRSRMVLVMSRDHPLNQLAYCGSPVDRLLWFDLRKAADAPFLIGMKGQRIRQVTEIVFQKAGISPEIAMRSQNVETLRRIAAAGYGLTIMPEHYLHGFDQTLPASYYYLPPEQDFAWTIVLAYYHQSELSLPVQKLIDIMDHSPLRNIFEE